jgi:3-deoxy-manno-octulosonate cytidylyltransferase (CMP-KDO synthetase)
MDFKVVIPARYASTRLPGKPLLEIAGRPMLQHVFERVQQSGASEVIIATDDARIAAAASGFNAEVCMTSTEHRSGTERLGEVVGQTGWGDDTIVVNVQGDEPMLPADGYALYFSRAPIPCHRDGSDRGASGIGLRHIGLYVYRAGFLKRYGELEPSPLETAEKLEQLRVLWYGMRIHVGIAAEMPGPGVDTAEDLERIAALL